MSESIIQCGDLICALYDEVMSTTNDSGLACCLAALSTFDLVAQSDNPELLLQLMDS